MFSTLNRFIARLDSDPLPQASSTAPTDCPYGFQVLRNINAELPIEPWFDFVVGINGHVIVSRYPNSLPNTQPFTHYRTIQILNSFRGKSGIALVNPSRLVSGAPRYGVSQCLVHVVSEAVIGPANSCLDRRCTTCAPVSRPHPPTRPSQRHAKHLAHPVDTFSTISSPPRWPTAPFRLHTWHSIRDSSR
jgi:hypothetical protein